MSTPDSNAGQNEFAQIFERLAKDFKMTKADVARALLINRSYVSMLVEGQRRPGKRLLEALRVLERGLRGGGDQNALANLDEDLRGIMEQLRRFRDRDSESFLAVERVVEGLAGRG